MNAPLWWSFELPGQPQALRRPRRAGGRIYDPTENRIAKRDLALAFRATHSGPPVDGAVAVEIDAWFGRPKSHYRADGTTLRDSAPLNHAQKPDADNIAKLACDALEGVAWRSDAQVASLTIAKHWGTTSRLLVRAWLL